MTDTTVTMIGNVFAAFSLFVFGVLMIREALRNRHVDPVRHEAKVGQRSFALTSLKSA